MIRPRRLTAITETLRNSTFRLFITGKFMAQVTMWMYRLALSWMVWDMTHSPTWLGIFGFLDYAPVMFVSPIAGVLADRINRMKLLQITQVLLLLHALTLSLLIFFDLMTIELLAAWTVYFGVVSAIQIPASQSVVPNLVTRDTLTSAYGLNSLAMNISRFIGPMLAGFIVTWWGTAEAIFCNVLGLSFFSVCLARMKVDIREGRIQRGHTMLRDIHDGFRYARRHPGIGPLFVMLIMLSILTFPIIQLMPSFADGIFHAGPKGLSWMIAVFSIGALLQGAYLAQRGAINGLTGYILVNILILGAGFVLLTATDLFWFGLLSIFVVGFATAADKVGALTLVQYSVEGDMRGRVASFYGMIHHGGPAIGSVLLGAMGDWIGIRPTIAIAGVLTIAIFIWAKYHQGTMAPALESEDERALGASVAKKDSVASAA